MVQAKFGSEPKKLNFFDRYLSFRASAYMLVGVGLGKLVRGHGLFGLQSPAPLVSQLRNCI